MAYLNPEDDEKKKQENAMLAGFGAGGLGAATGSAAPSVAAATGPQESAPQQSSSNGFVPFSAYYTANEGAAKGMAQEMGKGVGDAADAAKTGLGAAQGWLQGGIDQGSPFLQQPSTGIRPGSRGHNPGGQGGGATASTTLSGWGGGAAQQSTPTQTYGGLTAAPRVTPPMNAPATTGPLTQGGYGQSWGQRTAAPPAEAPTEMPLKTQAQGHAVAEPWTDARGHPISTTGGTVPANGNPTISNDRGEYRAPVAPVVPRPVDPRVAEDARNAANAKKAYTGPEGLAKAPGFDDLTNKTNAAQDSLNLLGGFKVGKDGTRNDLEFGQGSGLQTLAQEKYGKDRTYSGGQSRMDAALMQAAGGRDFEALTKKYGDMVGNLHGAEVKGAADVQAARDGTAATAAGYGQQHAAYLAEEEAKRAHEAALKANGPGVAGKAPKAQSYEDYLTMNAQDVIRNVGKQLSPIDMLAGLFGGPSPIDLRTKSYEAGSATNSNRATYAFNLFKAGAGDENAKKVYDSMTQDELTALEGMNWRAQTDWLNKRLTDMAGGSQ